MKLGLKEAIVLSALTACGNETKDTVVNNSDTAISEDTAVDQPISPYECELALAAAETLTEFTLAVGAIEEGSIDVLTHDGQSATFNAILDGNPDEVPACYVYPADGVGNGWEADVNAVSQEGQPDTITVQFDWSTAAVEGVHVYCVPQVLHPLDCTKVIPFDIPAPGSSQLDYLYFNTEQFAGAE